MINQFDIVEVLKRTRAKFKDLKKAEPGKKYLVTSTYTPATSYSMFSTPVTKVFLIDEENNVSFTTEACLKRQFNLYDYSVNSILKEKWLSVKKFWMEKEYVPVIVQHKYAFNGYPMISSKDERSFLVSPINKNVDFWVNVTQIHDDDITLFTTSSFPVDPGKRDQPSEAVTIRVPLWFAKGKGLF